MACLMATACAVQHFFRFESTPRQQFKIILCVVDIFITSCFVAPKNDFWN